MLREEIEYYIENRDEWIDPYDCEDIDSKYLRAIIKRAGLFIPKFFYKFGILKTHFWPENLVLLGIAALNYNYKDLVEKIINELISFNNKQLYWGLPIDWHSGEYLFPKNTLMSTTTAETILFMYDINKKYSNMIDKEILITAASNLYSKLNRISIQGNEYMYSYTPLDSYKVFNSNLLVAAALATVGNKYNVEQFLESAYLIVKVCEKYLPDKGYVPYHFGGKEITADSYHQLFSIRALYYMSEMFPEAEKLFSITLDYFWNEFYDSEKKVIKLKPNREIWDLQPFSEALRVMGLIGDVEGYKKIFSGMDIFKKNNKIIQRVWPLNLNIKIKSNVCYSRQGLFRLYAGISYGEEINSC
jgi:hypothetical protein